MDVVGRLALTPCPEGDGFLQPCAQLRGTICAVYADRPGPCRKYRCEVLKSAEAGTMPIAAALDLIAVARRLQAGATTAGAAALPDQRREMAGKSAEWPSGDAGDRQIEARARVAQVALERHLDKHFRRDKQRQLVASPATPEPRKPGRKPVSRP